MPAAEAVGWGIGGAGVVIAVGREWAASRERRRARPVVIVHEEHGRHFSAQGFAVSVYLTNESAASAFNIRFGVKFNGVLIPWKHNDDDEEEPSRLNVLRPGERHPETGSIEITVPKGFGWSGPGVDDAGRTYWAYYQGPGGEWWTTRNPWARDADLKVEHVRLRRWTMSRHARRRSRQLAADQAAHKRAWRELTETLDESHKRRT